MGYSDRVDLGSIRAPAAARDQRISNKYAEDNQEISPAVLVTHFLRTAASMLLLSSTACIAQSATLSMPQMPLHDPFILANEADRTYYLYTSNVPAISGISGVGTMAYRSADLQHWEKPRIVFTVPTNAFAKEGAWAPEVHSYKGRYYLLTTLYDDQAELAAPPAVPIRTVVRGTALAVSDSPLGPFRLVHPERPVVPADSMTLDGTLYTDGEGKPWLVYAHEWIQKLDGTIEALPLADDLASSSGPAILLFRGSEAPWLSGSLPVSNKPQTYVTDGPELYRSRDGHLLMLWASYENGSYVQTVARSATGQLSGPWQQSPPLVKNDSGHGMLFKTFEGKLILVLHHPFRNARGRLFEVEDKGDQLKVTRERLDLDGAEGSLLP